MLSTNAHLQWMTKAQNMLRGVPSACAMAKKNFPDSITQIGEMVRRHIALGEEIVRVLQSPELRSTLLSPEGVAYDAKMASIKIDSMTDKLRNLLRQCMPQDDEGDDDDIRGGPPHGPVPILDPNAGSGVAAAQTPPAFDDDESLHPEKEHSNPSETVIAA